MLPSKSLLALAICAALACGSDQPTVPIPVVATDLNGSWTQLGNIPGSSEQWTLSTADTVVSGNGTWTGEACCGGTQTISGYVSRDSVHLFIVNIVTTGATLPRDPFETQFHGVLQSPTLLVGTGGERFQKR
jgi:hypothetical protein